MIMSRSIHVAIKCIISFFLRVSNIPLYIYKTSLSRGKKKEEENYNSKRYKHPNVHHSIILQKPRHGSKLKCPSTDKWIKKMSFLPYVALGHLYV